MTKAELIDRIARSRELPPEVTKKVIAKILDLTFAELATYFIRSRLTRTSTPRFSYPKFGTFTKKKRSGRRGVNPRTLEPMEIEACETLDFKPSTELKRLLNESSAKSKTKAKAKTKSKAKAKVKTTRTKKAARSSTKKKASRAKAQSGTSKSKSKSKTKTKVSGPGRRKLVTRDEVELELPLRSARLPEAPLSKVEASKPKAKRRRTKLDGTGN